MYLTTWTSKKSTVVILVQICAALCKADCLRVLYKRQQNCRYLIGVFTLLLVTHLCYPNSQYLSPQKKYLDLKASESLYHLLKKFQERVGGGYSYTLSVHISCKSKTFLIIMYEPTLMTPCSLQVRPQNVH